MSEWNLKSPLLADMQVLSCLADQGGISTYLVKSVVTEKNYVFKLISVPESQTQVEGLRYSGAIKTAGEAQAYYAQVANTYKEELEVLKTLSESGCIDCYPSWHIAPKEEDVGYDIHLLAKHRQTLTQYLDTTPMTHAKAANLAMDLCRALGCLRKCGYVHCNLKPNNIYLNSQGHFILGGLGIYQESQLKYAAVPERMLGKFAAPELFDVMQSPNATVDIYALGLLLYSVYNGGHNPFEDEQTSAKGASEKRLSGAQLPAPLFADYEMASIILKACAFDPSQRYQTPGELYQDLQDYVQRNVLKDDLIVPPIVADEDLLLTEEAMNEEMEPLRITSAEDLGEDFVHHFTPDENVLAESIEAVNQAREESEDAAEEVSPEVSTEVPAEETAEEATFEKETAEEEPASEEVPAESEETETAPAEEDVTVTAEEAPKEKKKSSKWAGICAAVAGGVILLIAAFFLLFPHVDGMEVVSSGTSALTVHLNSIYGTAFFDVTCSDTYGNAYEGIARDGNLEFTELDPGTQYTFRVRSAFGTKVRGQSTFTAATAMATEVLSFIAKPLSETEVELSFTIEGQDQQTWTIAYSVGNELKEVSFSGHSVVIKDLEPNTNYLFTLQNSEAVALSGQIIVHYNGAAQVEVIDITAKYTDSGVTLAWTFEGETPRRWAVQYTDIDGSVKELVSETAEIAIDGIQAETDYVIEIFCDGMARPAKTTVHRMVAQVASFEAEAGADGVDVSWASEDSVPGGWQVTASLAGSGEVSHYIVTEETSVLLTGLIPATEYEIAVAPANGWAAEGEHTKTLTTAETAKFSDYGCTSTYLGMFQLPAKENWTAKDLVIFRDAYTREESIAFAMQILSTRVRSNDTVTVTYALRGADGKVATAETRAFVWNDMWTGDLFVDSMEKMPEEAGAYDFEIYFNGHYVIKRSIEIQ